MGVAEAFPDPSNWGLDSLVGGNNTDMFFAAMETWRNVGGLEEPYVASFVFGFIIVILGVMTYVRYQKILPSLLAMWFGTILINAIEIYYYSSLNRLMMGYLSYFLHTAFILGIAFYIWTHFRGD